LMIQPLNDVRDRYLPEVGADRTGRRFAFWGYTVGQKRLLRSKSARRTA